MADQYNDRIQVFDSGVNFVAEWGASGVDSVVDPMDVELDPHGNVYVVERDNHRVQKFRQSWLDVFVGEPEPSSGR